MPRPAPSNWRGWARAGKIIGGVHDLPGLVWEWVTDFHTAMVTGDARGETWANDKQQFPAAPASLRRAGKNAELTAMQSNSNADDDEARSEAALKDALVAHRAEAFHSEFAPLIDELYREEVLDARQMPLEEKLILGERPFRWACEITPAGIRHQHPGASEQECQHILRGRIELGKKMGTL